MLTGHMIDDLIAKVEKAERDSRVVERARIAARVTRHDAFAGFIYAVQFNESAMMAGVA